MIERVAWWQWPIILLGLFFLSPCLVPLAHVILAAAAIGFLTHALIAAGLAVVRGDAAHWRQAARQACLAVLCAGFALLGYGLLLGWESSFVSPPTLEEKAAGRRLAYIGGFIAATGAILAYLCDHPGHAAGKHVEKRKHGIDDLAD